MIDQLKLYNPVEKKEYLDTFPNEDSRLTIGYVLQKAAGTERILERDLYTFSLDEIASVLMSTNPLNLNVAQWNGTVFKKYIDWGRGKGRFGSNDNPLTGIPNEWYKQFVSEKKLYLSEDEIIEIEDNLRNYQDKVCVRLPFEGVSGHLQSEISNLQESDINFEARELTLHDTKKGDRKIIVSERAIEIIKGALEEEIYIHELDDDKIKKSKLLQGVNTSYVVRGFESKRPEDNPDKPVSFNVPYRRSNMIKGKFDLPYLTIKQIEKSGMIKIAKDLIIERGKFGKEERNVIGDQFNMTKQHINGYTYYSSQSMKFINSDIVRDLYNLDMNGTE